MMEFMVLGEIPGTNLVITFNWLLVMTAVALVAYDATRIMIRKKQTPNQETDKKILA